MQFQLLSSIALAGAALAGASSDVYDYTVTEVVTALTTYCPEPTTIVTNNRTYTVTEATTLTITDCPCTLTHTSKGPETEKPTSSETVSSYSGAAAKAGVAGLAAAAGAAVYLL